MSVTEEWNLAVDKVILDEYIYDANLSHTDKVKIILAEDIKTNGTIPISRLAKYREVLGAPSLLRALVENGIVSNMDSSYKEYITSLMLPTSLKILRDAGYQFSTKELNEFLTTERWIVEKPAGYINMLKLFFGDSSIMFRKWERYAEGVRTL
jgi:hypothetical protein